LIDLSSAELISAVVNPQHQLQNNANV